MFVLITGKPRSGKSYYAVSHMVNKKDDYNHIYANVNGLKMSDNIKPLNFLELMAIVSKCKEIYDSQLLELGENTNENVIDKPIIEYLLSIDFIKINPKYNEYVSLRSDRDNLPFLKKKILNIVKPLYSVSKYLPVLIIMDEAQNQLPAVVEGKKASPDSLISWWISYHGHLYMDVFLLSQNYHKINSAYLYDIEYFLDAVSSSRSLFGNFSKTFTYKHHVSTPYYNTNLAGKKKIKKEKKVFDAYESGDKVRTKSVILPYILFSLFGLVLVVLIFSYVSSSFTSSEDINNTTVTSAAPHKYTRISSDSYSSVMDYSSSKYITLKCIGRDCTGVNNINIDVSDLKVLLKDTHSKFLRKKTFSKNLSYVYLLVSPTFINLFQGAKNEKMSKGFSIIN